MPRRDIRRKGKPPVEIVEQHFDDAQIAHERSMNERYEKQQAHIRKMAEEDKFHFDRERGLFLKKISKSSYRNSVVGLLIDSQQLESAARFSRNWRKPSHPHFHETLMWRLTPHRAEPHSIVFITIDGRLAAPYDPSNGVWNGNSGAGMQVLTISYEVATRSGYDLIAALKSVRSSM